MRHSFWPAVLFISAAPLARTATWAWAAMLGLSLTASVAFAEPTTRPVRLFILSGQSNMDGLRPDVSFTPAISKAFPNDDLVVVKHAAAGQPILYWYKGWKAPAGETVKEIPKVGTIYNELLSKVRQATEAKPVATTITFVWMQGEADTKYQSWADIYGASLSGLVAQLRKDLKRNDVDVVIGRISDYDKFEPKKVPVPGWETVRQAQVKFAESDGRAAWVDTDDLNGDNDSVHYTREGSRILGERFAEKAIQLITAANEKRSDRKPSSRPSDR